MLRAAEDCLRFPGLDDLSGVQERDRASKVRDGRQVIGPYQHGQVLVLVDAVEEGEDLALR